MRLSSGAKMSSLSLFPNSVFRIYSTEQAKSPPRELSGLLPPRLLPPHLPAYISHWGLGVKRNTSVTPTCLPPRQVRRLSTDPSRRTQIGQAAAKQSENYLLLGICLKWIWRGGAGDCGGMCVSIFHLLFTKEMSAQSSCSFPSTLFLDIHTVILFFITLMHSYPLFCSI